MRRCSFFSKKRLYVSSSSRTTSEPVEPVATGVDVGAPAGSAPDGADSGAGSGVVDGDDAGVKKEGKQKDAEQTETAANTEVPITEVNSNSEILIKIVEQCKKCMEPCSDCTEKDEKFKSS